MLDITPETEQAIITHAKEQGLTVNELLAKAFNIDLSANTETLQAIDELAGGKGVRFNSVDELMADLR